MVVGTRIRADFNGLDIECLAVIAERDAMDKVSYCEPHASVLRLDDSVAVGMTVSRLDHIRNRISFKSIHVQDVDSARTGYP